MNFCLFAALLVFFRGTAVPQQPPAPAELEPRVADNSIFVSPGDRFGVNLAGPADGTAVNITYQPDLKKADLVLGFKKEKKMMLLTVENRTSYWVSYEAYMKVPERDGLLRTTVLPMGPRVSSSTPFVHFESWPQSITELVLRNFRLSDTAPGARHSR